MDLRKALDRDQPGWTEEVAWCPRCHVEHILRSGEKQLPMMPADQAEEVLQTRRRMGFRRDMPPGWCRWHETASPQLITGCAWCQASLHVHKDAVGRVKSGRESKGYLVQRCPRCHHENAVYPHYRSRGGIRTSKLEGDTPVIQLNLGRV